MFEKACLVKLLACTTLFSSLAVVIIGNDETMSHTHREAFVLLLPNAGAAFLFVIFVRMRLYMIMRRLFRELSVVHEAGRDVVFATLGEQACDSSASSNKDRACVDFIS